MTGKYIVNFDIYEEIPKNWKQKPKILHKKGDIVSIVEYKDRNVYEEQFIMACGRWFKKHQITKIH